jgi:hypothetical protein
MKIQGMVFHMLLPCSDVVGYQCFMVNMEAMRSSDLLVSYHITTKHHSLEDHGLNVLVKSEKE